MSMTLRQLGEEYLENVKYEQEILKRLKRERRELSGSCSEEDLCLLNRQIGERYAIIRDMRITAAYLIGYYSHKKGGGAA